MTLKLIIIAAFVAIAKGGGPHDHYQQTPNVVSYSSVGQHPTQYGNAVYNPAPAIQYAPAPNVQSYGSVPNVQSYGSAPIIVKFAPSAPKYTSTPLVAKYTEPQFIAKYQEASPLITKYETAAPVVGKYSTGPLYAKYAESPLKYEATPALAKYETPIYAKTYEPEPSAPANYEFEYSVNDPHTGDSKSQKEVRRGDQVQGSYSVVDADGTKRTVEYTADAHNGFNAVIHREPAVQPIPVKSVPYAHLRNSYDAPLTNNYYE